MWKHSSSLQIYNNPENEYKWYEIRRSDILLSSTYQGMFWVRLEYWFATCWIPNRKRDSVIMFLYSWLLFSRRQSIYIWLINLFLWASTMDLQFINSIVVYNVCEEHINYPQLPLNSKKCSWSVQLKNVNMYIKQLIFLVW